MSNQFPTRSKNTKPEYGRLVFIRNNGQEVDVITGAWGVLQSQRMKLKQDPQFRGGTLKLKHL